jgi:major membrane immunogen (membrane-anchored lipoprotein)
MKHARGLAAVLVVAALTAALFACGSSNDDTTDTATAPGGSPAANTGSKAKGRSDVPTIVIRNGEPVGGIAELEYSAGEEVRFRVKSDVADEVHVHGYDLMQDVPAGGSVEFDFPADIEGIFEAELEGRQEQILELRINP